MLHRLAVKFASDEDKGLWRKGEGMRFEIEWPEIGQTEWKEKRKAIPEFEEKRWERWRMKGKQKPPPGREEITAKGNNVIKEVAVKK